MTDAGAEKRLFIAWDMSVDRHRDMVRVHHGKVRGGRQVFVPGAVSHGDVISKIVLNEIEKCDTMVALVDRANANVGFEIGYAFGRGKSVLLAYRRKPKRKSNGRESKPKWTDRAPLANLEATPFATEKEFSALLENPVGRRIEAQPRSGTKTLVLCPEEPYHAQQCVRDGRSRANWMIADPSDVFSVDTMSAFLADFLRVVWIFVPPEDTGTYRDGNDNAAWSVVAGFALAQNREVHHWSKPSPKGDRILRDVELRRKAWGSVPDLERLIESLEVDARPETAAAAVDDGTIRSYRNAALAEYGQVRLFGFPEAATPSLKLDDVHVRVSCETALRPTAAEKGLKGGRGDGVPERGAVEFLLQRSFRPDGALSQGVPKLDTVVLRGGPGAGKSTQLRRYFLKVFRSKAKKRAKRFGLASECVPLYLPLKHLTSFDQTLADLVRLEWRRLGVPDDGLVERMLARRDLLLLLDGLDEVTAPSVRERVEEWIVRERRRDLGWKVVVSTRVRAFALDGASERPLLKAGGAAVVDLRPLSPQGQERLVGRWYRAVERSVEGADLREADARAKEAAEKLNAAITEGVRGKEGYRALIEIAANPLLLTAACLVHREQGGDLPGRRVQLFQACVDALLRTWRSGQGVPVALDAEDARTVLRAVARFMQERGAVEASLDDLEPVVAAALVHVGRSQSDARPFLDRIREESGLLTGVSATQVGFLHNAFREFLAAQWYWRHVGKGPDVLARLVAGWPHAKLATSFGPRDSKRPAGDSSPDRDWWQETIGFFLAFRDPCYFDEYFRALLAHEAFGEQASQEFLQSVVRHAAAPSAEPFLRFLRETADAKSTPARLGAIMSLFGQVFPDRVKDAAAAVSANSKASNALRSLFGLPLRTAAAAPKATATARTPEPAPRPPREASQHLVAYVEPRTGMEFVLVPVGTFDMGQRNLESDSKWYDEQPVRKVTISRPFLLARFPVTNAQWAEYLKHGGGATEPKFWRDEKFNGPEQPVVGVSWHEAVAFSKWLGNDGRLPTEAEWEYACRGRKSTRFWKGDDDSVLNQVGWFAGKPKQRTADVGLLEANAFGLHDVHGNVWEWCSDWYAPKYPKADEVDPNGPSEGPPVNVWSPDAVSKQIKAPARVCRGGSWKDDADGCRSAARNGVLPRDRRNYLGFRPALSAPSP